MSFSLLLNAKLFDDKELYDKMHEDSLKLGIKDSSSRIYKVIEEVIGHDEWFGKRD